MAIPYTTWPTLTLEALQDKITFQESEVGIRLISLTGRTEGGVEFNAHKYESVDDDTLPFSKLFEIPKGSIPADDRQVKTWLESHQNHTIKCCEEVYISGSLKTVAAVR